MVGKKKLISDVKYITSYAVSHNSAYILGGRLSSLSVVKGVSFIGQEIKRNACWYLETIGKYINPTFYTRIVV